jgi:hypothetical protein
VNLDPLPFIIGGIVYVELLLIASYHGWLDWVARARVMRPFVVVSDRLGSGMQRLFDVAESLPERLVDLTAAAAARLRRKVKR